MRFGQNAQRCRYQRRPVRAARKSDSHSIGPARLRSARIRKDLDFDQRQSTWSMHKVGNKPNSWPVDASVRPTGWSIEMVCNEACRSVAFNIDLSSNRDNHIDDWSNRFPDCTSVSRRCFSRSHRRRTYVEFIDHDPTCGHRRWIGRHVRRSLVGSSNECLRLPR